MYRTQDVLDDLTAFGSARGRFDKLAGTQGTELLQKLKAQRPDAIPYVAKAKLDEINKLAFSGKSTGPQQALKAFDKIEPESLKILFPDPGHAADLRDLYEIMALRAKNVNPSGTFLSAAKWGEVSALLGAALGGSQIPGAGKYALAAPVASVINAAMGVASHSSTITKLLVQGKNIPLKNPAAIAIWSNQLEKALEANRRAEARQRYPGMPGNIQLPAMPQVTIRQ